MRRPYRQTVTHTDHLSTVGLRVANRRLPADTPLNLSRQRNEPERIEITWWHDTTGWAGWFNVSGGIAKPGSEVAAISRVTEHIDVFVVGSDGIVNSTWWDGSGGWAGWFQLGIT